MISTAPRQTVEIPYAPRQWAKPLHRSLLRWAVLVLHRRAGKTTSILNHHQRAAMDDQWELARLRSLLPLESETVLRRLLPKRNYWHVMPTYRQAKQTAWEMLKDFARPIPGHRFNESELYVEYPTGHRVRLVGADDPDSLRGPGLSGLSLDEYSQIPSYAFSEVLSKSLADHLGYCIWAGTIKGHDQLYKTYHAAKDDPTWFALWQDIDASLSTEQGATITTLTRAMQDDRELIAQGVMSQAEFDQEWYLSPEAAIKGAIYLNQLAQARKEGRITTVPYDSLLPVDTDWDIGFVDATAIWFSQSTPAGQVKLIDYYEATGEALPHYAKVLREKGYHYGTHTGPWDISVTEPGSGKTFKEMAQSLGLHFQVCPKVSVDDGIGTAKAMLTSCWFDEAKTRPGLEALSHYRRRYNTSLNELSSEPVHDWSSHGADAFRYLAVRWRAPKFKRHTENLRQLQRDVEPDERMRSGRRSMRRGGY